MVVGSGMDSGGRSGLVLELLPRRQRLKDLLQSASCRTHIRLTLSPRKTITSIVKHLRKGRWSSAGSILAPQNVRFYRAEDGNGEYFSTVDDGQLTIGSVSVMSKGKIRLHYDWLISGETMFEDMNRSEAEKSPKHISKTVVEIVQTQEGTSVDNCGSRPNKRKTASPQKRSLPTRRSDDSRPEKQRRKQRSSRKQKVVPDDIFRDQENSMMAHVASLYGNREEPVDTEDSLFLQLGKLASGEGNNTAVPVPSTLPSLPVPAFPSTSMESVDVLHGVLPPASSAFSRFGKQLSSSQNETQPSCFTHMGFPSSSVSMDIGFSIDGPRRDNSNHSNGMLLFGQSSSGIL